MTDWLVECDNKKLQITDAMIRDKGKEIALKWNIGEDKFKASAGWVENFKHRKGIRRGVWMHREDFAPSGRLPSEEPQEDLNAGTYDQEAFYDRRFGDYDPATGTVPLQERQLQERMEAANLDPASSQPYALVGATGVIPANENVIRDPDQPELSSTDQTSNNDRASGPLGDEYYPSQTQLESAPLAMEDTSDTQYAGHNFLSNQSFAGPDQTVGYFDADGVWTDVPFDPSDGPGEVSAQEAEKGLDLVIKFVKQQGPGFLDPAEAGVLQFFKSLLYNTAQGLPAAKRPRQQVPQTPQV